MVGRAASDPKVSTGPKGDRVTLRVVSTERRHDEASGDWVDGDEFGVSVVCWRQLAANVLQLVRKGDPVLVRGRISTRKFDREGVVDYFTEVKAEFIGFDVAKGAGRLRRAQPDAAGGRVDLAKYPGSAQATDGAALDAGPLGGLQSTDAFGDPLDDAPVGPEPRLFAEVG